MKSQVKSKSFTFTPPGRDTGTDNGRTGFSVLHCEFQVWENSDNEWHYAEQNVRFKDPYLYREKYLEVL